MKLEKQKILQLTEKVVKEYNFFLIDIDFRGDNRNWIIEIFIDNASGVSADGCKMVSKKLAAILEEEELIKSKYRLVVSSPGIDRPLKYLAQYPKHINRSFELEYSDGEEIRKTKGKLIKIENSNLIFTSKKNEIQISFNNIKSAKVLISF